MRKVCCRDLAAIWRASWVYGVQCSLTDAGGGVVPSGRVDLSGEHLDATRVFETGIRNATERDVSR